MRKRRGRVSCSAVDEKSFVLPPDPRVGSVVCGRYRIVRLIGEGGMGAVYEGEHVLIRRRVAIKFLHAQYARTPAALTRFRREALAATATGNPHVVEVTDMDQAEDGSPFMVLEFLEGKNLWDEVEQHGPLSIARALKLARQLCRALSDVHERGITHRDLKPENLFLVTRDGQPDFLKILDFGISKFSHSDDGLPANLTKTGATVGSIYFMAPEQARGRADVGPRADIYAVGGILFFLLTGRAAFEGDSLPYMLMQIVSDPAPRVELLRPDVPAALSDCVARALSKDQAARFPDCMSFERALAAIDAELAQVGLAVTRVSDAPRLSPAIDPTTPTPASHRTAPMTPVPAQHTGEQVRSVADSQADSSVSVSRFVSPRRSHWLLISSALVLAGVAGGWLLLRARTSSHEQIQTIQAEHTGESVATPARNHTPVVPAPSVLNAPVASEEASTEAEPTRSKHAARERKPATTHEAAPQLPTSKDNVAPAASAVPAASSEPAPTEARPSDKRDLKRIRF
jgi:serine/threonine protein kinase